MSQEAFWILLAKKLSGEATPEELRVLQQLILENPEWQYAIQNLETLWNNKSLQDPIKEEDAYMIHLQRMNEKNIPMGNMSTAATFFSINDKKNGKRSLYLMAAAVLLLFLAWKLLDKVYLSKSKKELARQVYEITTRPGSTSKVKLPDGSIVWLNAGSQLTYNKEFGKDLREVTLSGEGYFDVKHIKDKPFVIKTFNLTIRVLGTVFNVKAYPEDKRTETSLFRGSIEVTIKNRPNNKIILSPSEKLVVGSDISKNNKLTGKTDEVSTDVMEPLVSVNKLRYSQEDSSVAETAWINNRLVFRDETLEDVAIMMERRYEVKIQINNQKLRTKKLNGTFEQESVIEVLNALKEMIPSLKYDKLGNKIIIY